MVGRIVTARPARCGKLSAAAAVPPAAGCKSGGAWCRAGLLRRRALLLLRRWRRRLRRPREDDVVVEGGAADGALVDVAKALGAHAQVPARQQQRVLGLREADHALLGEVFPCPAHSASYPTRRHLLLLAVTAAAAANDAAAVRVVVAAGVDSAAAAAAGRSLDGADHRRGSGTCLSSSPARFVAGAKHL